MGGSHWKRPETLIASIYLAGTDTRLVKWTLFGLFQGAVGTDVVSRARRAEVEGRLGHLPGTQP